MITEETSNVDWARLLLDDKTDDVIINVSREKIAHELIRLKAELKKAKSIDGNYEKLRRNNHNFQKPNNSSGFQLPPTVPRDMPSSLVAYGQLLPSKRQSSTITPNPTLRNYLEPIK